MADRIEKTVALRAPVDRVWRALTTPAEFGAWFRVNLNGVTFVPGQKAKGPMTYPGFEHVIWEVTVVAMEPQTRFAFNWHPYAVDPDVDYAKETPTLVEFTLAAEGEGTRLTVVESGFDAIPAHRRDEALRMNDGGWAEQMRNIQAHVER